MTRDRLATVVPRSFPVEVRRSMEVLCLPRTLHMEVHKVLCLPRNLHMEVHKVLRLPRNLHMEVHKVLRLPRKLELELLKLELPGARAIETRANWMMSVV